jgi:DNA repair exonuclease SbcCD ATPase subunit
MSQEKYTEYYVELLTSTFNDQVLQNISLKAREKVNSEIFEDVTKGYQKLLEENESLKTDKEKSLTEKEVARNTEIESLKKQISDLQSAKQYESEKLRQQINLTQSAKNGEIEEIRKKSSEQLQQVQASKSNEIEQLNKIINGLRDEVTKAGLIRAEYDKLKHQLNHMDTFRTQLVELQKTVEEKDVLIGDLNSQIENLKSVPATPVKRKKSNVEKVNTVQPESTLFAEETRDGGSF